MNDRNLDQLLNAWMDLGATTAPDRVADAARLEVSGTRQLPAILSRWAPRRFPLMNTYAKVALASAAVAIAALLGYNYLLAPNVGGPRLFAPDPRPSPSASPIPPALPPEGALEPGRYTVGIGGAPLSASFTVGDGWSSGGWAIFTETGFVGPWTVRYVYPDACAGPVGGRLNEESIGATVDDLVAALDAQEGTDLSAPTDVVVGGYSGVRVELTAADGVDISSCEAERLYLWVDATEGQRWQDAEQSGHDTLWILDVNGTRVLLDGSYLADDAAAEAAVEAVIDSLTFSAAP